MMSANPTLGSWPAVAAGHVGPQCQVSRDTHAHTHGESARLNIFMDKQGVTKGNQLIASEMFMYLLCQSREKCIKLMN